VQRTRSRPIRTGPVSVTRTGLQIPPGFHAGSMASQCENTPVTMRLRRWSVWGGQATSTASVCSSPSFPSWSVISNVWGAK